MSLRDYVDKLIDDKIRDEINSLTPLLIQSNLSAAQTLLCTVVDISSTGSLSVKLDSGNQVLTGIQPNTSKSLGVGTRGILVAGTVFLS